MTLEVQLHKRGITFTDLEEKRINRQIDGLAKRLEKFPDPRLELAIENHKSPTRVSVDMRVALGPLGGHIVSHQEGATADSTVKAASDDVKRQLEKRLAQMRGEPSYGVPSRRFPEDMRPNPPDQSASHDDDTDPDELDEESEAV
jgi:ribosome-associated translation inhibitor RaiA